MSKACRGEYFTHYPVILRRVATGEEKHLEYSVVPIRDEHGRPVSLAFNIVDLTEGKRAQAETRSKESTLNAILDASQESIFMFAKDTRILLANKMGIKRLGLPPENVIGKRFMDFLPKDVAEGRLAYLQKVIATGSEVQFEDVRNGICFLHSFSPVYAEDRSTMAVVTFSRDITERKLAEKALRESEERFRNLADSMPQLVWTAHSDGTVDYYNRRLNEFAGAKRNSDGSWAWAPMLHPDDVQRTKQAWTSAVRDKSVYTCEHRIRMVDGHYRWHLSRAFPTLDAEGHVIRWYGTATDVHALKETESALNEALRSRDEFLSIASHELKTPLTSLQLQTQITKRMISQQGEHKALAPERARAFLSQTDKQVQRLGRLIDDMLDISRISAGKLSIHREPVDLGALVVDTCEKLKPMADDARTRFDVTVQGDVRGEWDSFRLDQVITNLITNALKYGEHSPVQLRVWAEDNSACLSVTDHGRGIAHEDQSRIFQRFERAISATEVSGFGLGLFVTHEIVRLHGGSVTVDSQPGHGATFTVRLPPHAHSGMME